MNFKVLHLFTLLGKNNKYFPLSHDFAQILPISPPPHALLYLAIFEYTEYIYENLLICSVEEQRNHIKKFGYQNFLAILHRIRLFNPNISNICLIQLHNSKILYIILQLNPTGSSACVPENESANCPWTEKLAKYFVISVKILP